MEELRSSVSTERILEWAKWFKFNAAFSGKAILCQLTIGIDLGIRAGGVSI